MTRPSSTDEITVTNLGLFSLTNEELTGILQPSVSKSTDDDAYYTLSGIKTQPTTKGIYIKNKKKILIP